MRYFMTSVPGTGSTVDRTGEAPVTCHAPSLRKPVLLPHRLYTSNIDVAISFIGKTDFCRTRLSEFKKIQHSLWAKVPHPSGRTIRGNLHANKSSNYLRVVLQISLRTSYLVSFSQCLRYIVGAVICSRHNPAYRALARRDVPEADGSRPLRIVMTIRD